MSCVWRARPAERASERALAWPGGCRARAGLKGTSAAALSHGSARRGTSLPGGLRGDAAPQGRPLKPLKAVGTVEAPREGEARA